jgi:putative sigma-54 modulation protein
MTIRVLINSMEMELTPHLKEYVEKKLVNIDKYLDSIDEARVELRFNPSVRSDSDRQVAQFTIRGKNVLLRAEERSDDIYASIDKALDKIHRQIEKFKGKHCHIRNENGSPIDKLVAVDLVNMGSVNNLIIRRKTFPLEPMNEKTALETMQMLGHEEFFIFQNIENGNINVIYRRRDGSYGILEPQIR